MFRSFLLPSLASVAVLIGGFSTFYLGTDAGKAWTTESARKLDIKRNPRLVPNVQLLDANQQSTSVIEYDKPIVLIDFIYTQCSTTCIGLGLEFKQLQKELAVLGYENQVQLLSISFDLEKDKPEQLSEFLNRFGANDTQWDAAVFKTEKAKEEVLKALEVIVIPDRRGGFVHNAGIYMMRDNKVIEVFELNERSKILERIQSISANISIKASKKVAINVSI